MTPDNPQPPTSREDGYLVLPVKKDQFAEFVSGLLGKPQRIRRVIPGSFELHHSHIEQLHNLITQRLHQQNEYALIQLTTQLFYENAESVTLKSMTEFLSYVSVESLIPVALEVTWTTLVKFQDRNVPERQEVSVRFITQDVSHDQLQSMQIQDYPFRRRIGGVIYEVHHTARSWGNDMDSLLNKALRAQVSPPSQIAEFFDDRSQEVAGIVAPAFFFIANYPLFALVLAALHGAGQAPVSEGIIQRLFPAGVAPILAYVYFATTATIAGIIYRWLEYFHVPLNPSFLMLHDQAAAYKERTVRETKRKRYYIVLRVIGSLTLAVLSKFIFQWLQ